jgi:hypothetical protein
VTAFFTGAFAVPRRLPDAFAITPPLTNVPAIAFGRSQDELDDIDAKTSIQSEPGGLEAALVSNRAPFDYHAAERAGNAIAVEPRAILMNVIGLRSCFRGDFRLVAAATRDLRH